MKKIVGFLLVLFISCCSLLTAEEVKKPNPARDFKYYLKSDGTGVVITGYRGKDAEVIIPSVIKTFPVLSISGYYASSSFKNVTKVNLPEGLRIIDDYAFSNSNLESITIPDSVKSIESSAFYSCKNLKTVTMGNGVESLANSVFSGCNSLSDESKERLREVGYRGWF